MAKIALKFYYDNSAHVNLAAGEYDTSDPRLADGLAEYLVENGHAILLPAADPPADAQSGKSADDLSVATTEELTEFADENPADAPPATRKRGK